MKKNTCLKILKFYYDEALNDCPDISKLENNNSELSDKELADKYNRIHVDNLVNLLY